MDQITDLDARLDRAVVPDGAGEPVPDFSWDAVRLRAASLRPGRRRLIWRWWLALGVAATCLSGTAAAMASPQASGTMQRFLAQVNVLQVHTVTLARARADAGYTVVSPSGLPAGAQLLAISELPALGSAPAEFLFQYQIQHQARNGPFEVAEAPAGRTGSGPGPGFYVVFVHGALSIFGGRPAPGPAPSGAVGGAAPTPGGPHPCPVGERCSVRVVHSAGATAGGGVASNPNGTGPAPCPSGEVCVVTAGRPDQGAVSVAPVHGGAAGLSAHTSAVRWTVGGTDLILINPGTLTRPEVEAIQAVTSGS